MSHKTRLDVVVKLRERDEDKARRELADAQRMALAAESALREAAARARRDDRSRGHAALWELADAAHARALVEQRQAERAAEAANDNVGGTRQRFISAHARAEAMRRVVESRRFEAIRQEEAVERKMLDDVAMLMFVRS